MLLSSDETANAQTMINRKGQGTYELTEIYGSYWSNIKNPTTFGKKFKKTVHNGNLQNIKLCSLKSNNHHVYELF